MMGSQRSDDRVLVQVEQGQARVMIQGPAILELLVDNEQDERLAMVLCRLLRLENGKAALTHQQIAAAFGKKNRQDSQNHLQVLTRSGGSLAQMIMKGRGGRPTKIHPVALAAIARHWEQSPLASVEETREWLGAGELPADVPLPCVDEIRRTRCIEGNLTRIRSAIKRIVERQAEGVMVRSTVLFERLIEIVDLQNRKLREAGLESTPVPAIVNLALGHSHTDPCRLSATSRELMTALEALTTLPSAEKDELLSVSIGQWNLFALHCGTLYCSLQLSIGQVAALVKRSKSVVYRGLVTLARSLESLDLFPAGTRFSGVLGRV